MVLCKSSTAGGDRSNKNSQVRKVILRKTSVWSTDVARHKVIAKDVSLKKFVVSWSRKHGEHKRGTHRSGGWLQYAQGAQRGIIMAAGEASAAKPRQEKQYDYLLKFLLVGDSDVGKQEILSGLEDGAAESPFCSGSAYKTTTILLDGKRVKLQLWDTSGQGRFCTIIRSYSRGAQGILLVYDITNKWSFDGIDRWLKEVEEHAPGIPKVLVGNRLHLAFKRQVGERDAKAYADKNHMAFFEVSPLCDFNIRESFSELSRMALHRNGMERLWRSSKVLSLQELACRAIVARTTVYGIDQLPLPKSIKSHLKSYAMTTTSQFRYNGNRSLSSHHRKLRFVGVGHNVIITPGSSSGCITHTRTSCVGRNSCTIS